MTLEKLILILIVCIIFFCIRSTGYFLYRMWKEMDNKLYFFISYIIVTLLVVSGYGCMIVSEHYSVDSFNLIFDMGAYWNLQIGRYINCAILLLAEKWNLNQVILQKEFMLLWCLSMILMIMMISVGLSKCMKQLSIKKFFFLIAIVSLSIVNVFVMELMLFPEMAMVLILGNLSLGLSIYTVLNEKDRKKKWLLCIFYLLIALGSYQSYIGIFGAFSFGGLYLKWRDNRKNRYIEVGAAILVGGVVSFFNILFLKLLVFIEFIDDVGRGATFYITRILSNIKNLVKYQKSFWKDGDGILPEGIMPILGGLLILMIYLTIREIKDFEERIFFIFVLIGCYILSFAAHIIECNLILTPRSNLAVWSVIVIIFIIGEECVFSEKNNILKIISYIIVFWTIGINILIMQDMAANEQAMNTIDIIEAKQICFKINKYENETGNKITKVAVTGDVNSGHYQEATRYRNWELGARIMNTYYSNYRLISYLLGRELERTDMPDEVYIKYFEGKDWNYMNVDEQVICIDNILYLIIY